MTVVSNNTLPTSLMSGLVHRRRSVLVADEPFARKASAAITPRGLDRPAVSSSNQEIESVLNSGPSANLLSGIGQVYSAEEQGSQVKEIQQSFRRQLQSRIPISGR